MQDVGFPQCMVKSPLLINGGGVRHQMLAAVLVVEDESFKYRPSMCLVAELRHSLPRFFLPDCTLSKGKPNGSMGDSIPVSIYLEKP